MLNCRDTAVTKLNVHYYHGPERRREGREEGVGEREGGEEGGERRAMGGKLTNTNDGTSHKITDN